MVMMMMKEMKSDDHHDHVSFHDDDDDDDDDELFSSDDVSSVISSDNEESDGDTSKRVKSSRMVEHAFNDMSDLLQQLPIKRGLSKHFEGKSQSFTSLSKVSCLEDLAKPQNPYNKKLKSSKSYVGLSKKSTKSQGPSPRRNGSFVGLSSRPPTHPSHTKFSNQAPLIA